MRNPRPRSGGLGMDDWETVDIVGPPKVVGFVVLSRSNMALVACL
jgi:hypothetical protein